MHAMDDASDARELVMQCLVRTREAGTTLLAFLAARFRYRTQEEWAEAIAEGRVAIDGQPAKAEQIVNRGTVVATRQMVREPQAPTTIRIVHDGDGIVVVDKPAGLPFHADGAFVTRTLVARARKLCGEGLLPLHRLDRETSGLCLFARNAATARSLRAALDADTIAKGYDAIVSGVIADASLVLDAWIGRDPDSAIDLRRAALPPGTAGARSARTEVEVVGRGPSATLLRCTLRTGRTHQIRVHLAGIGHPVIGDKLYGRSDAEYLAWVAHVKARGDAAWGGRLGAPRQMLHAARLRVPGDGARRDLEFEAPWPADFAGLARAQGLAAPSAP